MSLTVTDKKLRKLGEKMMIKEKKERMKILNFQLIQYFRNSILNTCYFKSVCLALLVSALFVGCDCNKSNTENNSTGNTGDPTNPNDPRTGTCADGIDNCVGTFLVIRTQPVHVFADAGSTANFTAVISKLEDTRPGTIVYEWQRNTKGRTDWTSITGASGNTYGVPGVTFAGDNGRAVRLKACLSTDIEERSCVYTRAATIQVNRLWRGQRLDGFNKPTNIVISDDGLSALVVAEQLRPLVRTSQDLRWNTVSANPIILWQTNVLGVRPGIDKDPEVKAVAFIDNNNAVIASNGGYLYTLQKTAATPWNTVAAYRLNNVANDGEVSSIAIHNNPSNTHKFAFVTFEGQAPDALEEGKVVILSSPIASNVWTSVARIPVGHSTQDIALPRSLSSIFIVNRCHGKSINCGSNIRIANIDVGAVILGRLPLLTTIQIGSIVSNQEGLLARSRSVVFSPDDLSAYIGSRNGPVIEIARPNTSSVDWRSVGSLPNSSSTAKVLVSSDSLSVYFVNPNDNRINFIVRATPLEPWLSLQANSNILNSPSACHSRSSLDGYGMAIAPDGNSILISCTAQGTAGPYGVVDYRL